MTAYREASNRMTPESPTQEPCRRHRGALHAVALLAALLVTLPVWSMATEAAAGTALPPPLPSGSPNEPVAEVDLARYTGVWYEVARLPMFFQRNCVRDTTATYGPAADGRLTVTNRCVTADGGVIDVSGIARPTARAGALEVSFLPRALSWLPIGWADYWIIDLDPEYRWAVVGGPSRNALWVLSREPAIDPALLDRLRQRAEARGYVLDTLIVAGASASSATTDAMP